MGNTESSPLKYCSGNQGQLYTERRYGLKDQMNMGPSRVNFTVPPLGFKMENSKKVSQPIQLKQIRRQTRPSQQPVKQVSRQQMQDEPPIVKPTIIESPPQEYTNFECATRCKVDHSGLCDCQRDAFKKTAIELLEKQEAEEKKKLAASVKPRGVDVDKYLNKKEPSFNVYISCLDWDCDNYWDSVMKECKEMPKLEQDEDSAVEEIEQSIKDTMSVYDGLFGHVIVHCNGLVLYTDINGEKHCEDFDLDTLRKTFPMGISNGSLTKSIWFDDPVERDNCFDQMTKKHAEEVQSPPSYADVLANPDFYTPQPQRQQEQMPAEETSEDEKLEEDNIKVFEGINERDVIVHADNLVLFTDINGDKHCVNYNPRDIQKSFPNGISHGGLPKSIWFSDAQERDLCYALMQWNVDQYSEDAEEQDEYEGLYGKVTVHQDGQVEYTSLVGDKVKCYYEPSEIGKVFPMGIAYGRLEKTIWFNDENERLACFEAMRNIDN